MARLQAFFLLALCKQAFALMAPIPAYVAFLPGCQVRAVPGGPLVTLTGTVHDVQKRATQLNPNWAAKYTGNNSTDNRIESHGSNKRTDFSVTCDNPHGWFGANPAFIDNGIRYLSGVQGRPTNEAGPGNCGRDSKPKTLDSFGSIADGARHVLETCLRELDSVHSAIRYNRV
ncbi:hypothetical protein HRG_003543 [Hirsutella rhossiliensis]|uniref:Uncharacterized protein n=1 Tax=Hirsutella rhossiliensis TaxID=111463 RepID=A0A9P8N2Q1_9HYPO|nr:uncharacterized protein HRG_03543 [Hirsutella rhossiliensis]KAH0965527.1 hypothetical protein HRG_03543 [Hirsutella rhossiliensis]